MPTPFNVIVRSPPFVVIVKVEVCAPSCVGLNINEKAVTPSLPTTNEVGPDMMKSEAAPGVILPRKESHPVFERVRDPSPKEHVETSPKSIISVGRESIAAPADIVATTVMVVS